MAECNRILEKTAFCIAALTVSAPDIVRIMKERKKGDWLVNVE